MVQRTVLGCMLALVCLTLTGCADSHESLMKEMVSTMDSMVTDLEGGMAKDKLEAKYNAKFKSLKERGDKLGKLTPDQEKKLMEKFKPELEKLMPRMMAAAMKNGGAGMPDLKGLGF